MPDVTPSANLAGEAVTTGTVTDGKGRASQGTSVIAWAWPSQNELKRLKDGESFNTVPVAATVTDGRGRYQLVLDPKAVNRVLGRSDGVINYDTVVPNATGSEVVSRSANVQISPHEINVRQDVDSGTKTAQAQFRVRGPLTIRQAIQRQRTQQVTKACGWRKIANYLSRRVAVGATFSTTSNVRAQFTFTSGANASIGYATSISGYWHQGGTVSVSTQTQTNFSSVPGKHGRIYQKVQDYAEFTNDSCLPGWIPSYDEVRPVGGTYSGYYISASVPTATHCATYYGVSSMTQNKGKTTTWTNGVSTKQLVGFDLSSQAGYTNSAKASYTKTSGSRFSVCGTAGTPERDVVTGPLVAKP